MKQLIFLFLLISTTSFSQIEIYNLGLTDTTQKVMYEYHKNEFKVYGVDIDSTVSLIYDKDTLEFINNKFILYEFSSNSDTLKLYVNNVLIKTVFFEQREMPKFYFYLGDLRDSMVTKPELIYALEHQVVYVTFEPEFITNYSTVTGVKSIFIEKKNGKIICLERKKYDRKNKRFSNWSDEKWLRKCEKGWDSKYVNRGNSLRGVQIDKVKRMKRGDVLCIQLVSTSCSSCSRRLHYVNFRFIIK